MCRRSSVLCRMELNRGSRVMLNGIVLCDVIRQFDCYLPIFFLVL